MSVQSDQDISKEINKILTKAQLSPVMLRMINTSLNADNKTGELFKWAHLSLLSCDCVSGDQEVALTGAIAMEFFALAADIFDDIQDQDNDDLPWRKLPSVNAVNLATCLLMLAYEVVSTISDSGLSREVSVILNRTGIRASDGQFQEFLYNSSDKITLEQYFEVVTRKSGSLTACACKIGATIGGAPESLVLQLDQFGESLGIMSQIRNDLNDFLNFEKKNDFINNTKTLPYVYLSSILKGETALRFKQLTRLENGRDNGFGNKERDYLKQLTINEGVVHYCTVMYEIFRQKSMETIMAIPVLDIRKEKMIEIVEESV